MNRIVLSDLLGKGQNNLNLVRLFAALAVLFGHSFFIHGGGRLDPISEFIGFEYSGSIAVYIFFFISGILVTGSFARSGSAVSFVFMRLGRILPGLFICLVLSALIIGPVVTSLPVSAYLANRSAYSYIYQNLLLDEIQWTLPGVFDGNLYKSAVNGSLWSLHLEVRCYVLVLIAGLVGVLSTRRAINLFCLAALLAFWLWPAEVRYFHSKGREAFILPSAFFLFGMFCYANRDQIVVSWKVAAVILCSWLLLRDVQAGNVLLYLFIAYATLVLAAAKPMRRFDVKDDYSYGVYLYGFVVQQTTAHYVPDLTSYQSLILTIPITIALGFASWRLVEKPSLQAARILAASCEGMKVHAYAIAKRQLGSR